MDEKLSPPEVKPRQNVNKVIQPLVVEPYKYEKLVKYTRELQDYDNLSEYRKKLLDMNDPTHTAIYKIINEWYAESLEK